MKYLIPVLVVVLVVLGLNGIYVVGEGHAAVVTRFGQVEASRVGPGLHVKLPFVEQVSVYDTRAIVLQAEPADYKTQGGDALRVGFFVRWRIVDPDAYFKATGGDELQVSEHMAPVIQSALRAQVGQHSLAEVLQADGGPIDTALRAAAGAALRARLGIEVLDIGVERVLPPDGALPAVYKRMNAEADAQAGAIRSDGEASAAAIRAKADAADQLVLAAAAQSAAAVRGRGDAEVARIDAAASAGDPQFFRFWSSLQTWRKTFGSGGAVVVLDKDSPFMQAIDAGATDAPAGKR